MQDLYDKLCAKKEKDPNGVGQHEPGAKLDAGKLRPFLVYKGFIHALQELWNNGSKGAVKYTPEGWKTVPNAKERYMDAAFRHMDKHTLGELRDDETNTHHLVAAAWSLLAVAELELSEMDNK